MIPLIKIGDEVKVVWRKDFKFYKLVDIAVWEVSKKIKTVMFEEQKDRWDYDSHKKIKLKHKPKFTLKDGDQLIISNKTDTRSYQVVVQPGYDNSRKIASVFFNKFMGRYNYG